MDNRGVGLIEAIIVMILILLAYLTLGDMVHHGRGFIGK